MLGRSPSKALGEVEREGGREEWRGCCEAGGAVVFFVLSFSSPFFPFIRFLVVYHNEGGREGEREGGWHCCS